MASREDVSLPFCGSGLSLLVVHGSAVSVAFYRDVGSSFLDLAHRAAHIGVDAVYEVEIGVVSQYIACYQRFQLINNQVV